MHATKINLQPRRPHLSMFPLVTFFVLTSAAQEHIGGRILQGKEFTCCALVEYPNIYESKAPKLYGLDGAAIDYLEALRAKLGFRCSSMNVFNPTNVSFSSFIDQISDCDAGIPFTNSVCKCDVGVGGWIMTPRRHTQVRFLPPYAMTDIEVSSVTDGFESQNKGLSPYVDFSRTGLTILAILVALLAFIDACMKFQSRQSISSCFSRSVLWYKLLKGLLLVLDTSPTSVLAPDLAFLHTGSIVRFLQALVLYFAFLLLSVCLTLPLDMKQNSAHELTLTDLKECHVASHDVCIAAGDAVEDFWHNWGVDSACENSGAPKRLPSNRQVMNSLLKHECKYAITPASGSTWISQTRDCGRVRQFKTPLLQSEVSFVLGKAVSTEAADAMAVATLEIREKRGLRALGRWVDEREVCKTRPAGWFNWLRNAFGDTPVEVVWLRSFFMACVIVIVTHAVS